MSGFSRVLAVMAALAIVAAGAEALAFGDMSKMKAGASGKEGVVDKTPVEKAKGADAYTVADIFRKKADLDGKKVAVRGRVNKVSAGIMGKNWIHLRDGSGEAEKGTNDLVVTSQDLPKVGDVVTARGIVHKDKDFGSGYKYTAIVEEASVKP